MGGGGGDGAPAVVLLGRGWGGDDGGRGGRGGGGGGWLSVRLFLKGRLGGREGVGRCIFLYGGGFIEVLLLHMHGWVVVVRQS